MLPAPYYDEGDRTVFLGDNQATLAEIDDGFFDSVVSDPPYGLGFMGKAWDADVPTTAFWREVLRVCKPGAMALVFAGTRTYPFMALRMVEAGWELRDCLMWLYGTGFPKSYDVSKGIDKHLGAERTKIRTDARPDTSGTMAGAADTRPWIEESRKLGYHEHDSKDPATAAAASWNGWGTALKPAWEPILLCMKPLDGTFAENALAHGVAGLHVDAGRIGTERRHNPAAHNNLGVDGGLACAANVISGARETQGRDCVGRWPANVLLDEEAAALLDAQSGEMKSRAAIVDTSGHGNFGDETLSGDRRGPRLAGYDDQGGASRFFYVAKPTDKDRRWYNIHPTVKPTKLMQYLLQLVGTPTGGVTLDPFMGSGTTLVAAKQLGRQCVGLDLNRTYCEIAVKRLKELDVK